ncbi:acyl CoA:acetate/3-ketoacid CoA transferase [Bosea sp. 2KB_26]|uniref:acyl CoA:acetate/3-ketoacid CoA transferase n=1 Tax=Bosea sp. 2KB_26 TaxID=3237475 RepID=UPI003F93E94B
MSKSVITAQAAARLIPDDAVVTVSSSSGLNCPDAVLKAIGERFKAEGHPRNLTTLHPIAAGDMYGIDGIDHLAQPGLLSAILAGSYPSGPSSLPSPRIWSMIGSNEIAAWNVPSGILFDMHRDVAARRAGVLTKVGLDTFVDPRRHGCAMNDAARARPPVVSVVAFSGEEWLHFPNIVPKVAIIRGTTADERGNISMEHEGAPLGALDQAMAVRNHGGIVIAQVKRVVATGSLPTRQVVVPGHLVDHVVVDPDQRQTTGIDYDPAISGEIRVPASAFELPAFGIETVIARRAAMVLRSGWAVNLGFGVSAVVPRVLLAEGQAGSVTWAIEQGAVGGMPLTGFAFGCAANADAILPSPQQFTYFQGGGFDCALLSFLQVSAAGDVNVSRLGSRPYLTAGAGGFVDITAHAKRVVFSGTFTTGGLDVAIADGGLTIKREGKLRKFVPEAEHVTFSGRRSRSVGTDVLYVTERCVMRLTDEGPEVIEIANGIDLKRDVLEQADIPLKVAADLRPMDPRLFDPAPMGLVLGARS